MLEAICRKDKKQQQTNINKIVFNTGTKELKYF